VLLLEAGGMPPSGVAVPAFIQYVAGVSELNYFYSSVRQPHAMNRVYASLGSIHYLFKLNS